MTTKSKAKDARAIGAGFTRVFGCQVVEDLKNKISGFCLRFSFVRMLKLAEKKNIMQT